MNVQSKHIKTNPFSRVKAMTTVIGIKCKDGIVLASDSRGLSEDGKTEETKIFSIVDTFGIGAAGFADSIRDYIKNMNVDKFDSELSLRISLYKNALKFQEPTIPSNSNVNAIIDTCIYSPIEVFALVGTRLENGEYCLYKIQIRDSNKPPILIDVIDKSYGSVGSGRTLANLVLHQQNRINNLDKLDIDTTIGIALYVINEVKHFDNQSGEEVQIAIIDESGYKQILPNEHSKYYDNMINSLSNSLGKNLSDNGKFKDILKKIFPVSKTILL
jgi:20S proteasome alpha/beta subunit